MKKAFNILKKGLGFLLSQVALLALIWEETPTLNSWQLALVKLGGFLLLLPACGLLFSGKSNTKTA